MLRRLRKSALGFTMIELLLVVAIIAVLVAIAIPVFSNATKKSKEATCAQNRRSLKSELSYVYIDGDEDAVEKKFEEISHQYTCPEGGKIDYHLGEPGVVTVTCSIHNSPSNIINGALSRYNIDISQIQHLDSIDTKRTDMVNSLDPYFADTLKLAGANITSSGIEIKSQALVKTDDGQESKVGSGNGTLLIWTDRDISTYKGNEIQTPAICYNATNGRYTVGISNVKKMNNNNFYSLARESESKGFAGADTNFGKNFSTYEDAKKYYDELASKY